MHHCSCRPKGNNALTRPQRLRNEQAKQTNKQSQGKESKESKESKASGKNCSQGALEDCRPWGCSKTPLTRRREGKEDHEIFRVLAPILSLSINMMFIVLDVLVTDGLLSVGNTLEHVGQTT